MTTIRQISTQVIILEAIQTYGTILGRMCRSRVAETRQAVHQIRGGGRRRGVSGPQGIALATAVPATEGGGGKEKVEEDEGGEAEEEEEEGEYEGHDDAFEEDEKELSWAGGRVSLRRSGLPVVWVNGCIMLVGVRRFSIVVGYDWHVVGAGADLDSTAERIGERTELEGIR